MLPVPESYRACKLCSILCNTVIRQVGRVDGHSPCKPLSAFSFPARYPIACGSRSPLTGVCSSLGALTILAQLPGGYPRVLFCRSAPYTAIAAPPRADSYHPWAAKPPRLSNGLLSGSRPGWRTLLAGGLWGGAAVAGTGGPCGTVGIGVLPAAGTRGARWAGEARCCRPRAVRRAEGNLGVRAWRCAQSCVVRLSRATVMAIGQVALEAAFVCVRRGRAVSADDSKGADGGAAPEGG